MKHRYPSDYAPGADQHWAINWAWEIVDAIRPGVIPDDARTLLAGMIAGGLIKAWRIGESGNGMPYNTPHRGNGR